MSNYKEALKKIVDERNKEVLSSKEALESALREYGLTKEETDQALSEFDGFPLDDDDLMMISGGGYNVRPVKNGFRDRNPVYPLTDGYHYANPDPGKRVGGTRF